MTQGTTRRTLCQVVAEWRSDAIPRPYDFIVGGCADALQPLVDELLALEKKMPHTFRNLAGLHEGAEKLACPKCQLAEIVGHPGEDEGR